MKDFLQFLLVVYTFFWLLADELCPESLFLWMNKAKCESKMKPIGFAENNSLLCTDYESVLNVL